MSYVYDALHQMELMRQYDSEQDGFIEIAECDEDGCDVLYETASRGDHCPECGLCWNHCTEHTPESIRSMDELLLTEDDFDE